MENLKKMVMENRRAADLLKDIVLSEQTVKILKQWASEFGMKNVAKARKLELITFLEKIVKVENMIEAEEQAATAKEESKPVKGSKPKKGAHVNLLEDHTNTYRYRYLAITLSNQMGITLSEEEDQESGKKILMAHGSTSDLKNLITQFDKYITFIEKTRVSQWKKAKKNGTLIPNLEKSLILGMLHEIRSMADFKIKNEVGSTLKRNISDEDLVIPFYEIGKTFVQEMEK